MSLHELPAPKAILFDWDNTLVDTWPTIHAALNEMMRAMGREEWSLDHVKANVKKSMRDAFPQMFGAGWEEAAAIYQAAYRRMHLENLAGLDGAEETLMHLKGKTSMIGIVSNKKGDTLRKEVAHLGWEHFFDVAVGAGDADRDKPDPAPVLLALGNLEQEAGDYVWFIGDTVVDLEVANVTGCTPILYGPHETDEGSYEGFGFAAHVRDHRELMKIIHCHAGA